jgi:hypothetical protein
VDVEFRLIYKGILPSEGSGKHVKEKHLIRKQIHSQLRELWYGHDFLKRYTKPGYVDGVPDESRSDISVMASKFVRDKYRFVPLVCEHFGAACSLDILFLRRDGPGNLIRTGGDIDNRIKVLFDGLRIPKHTNELSGIPPEEGEDPFFCLLEDDALITDIKITTDRLLIPQQGDEHIHDVHLTLHVKTKMVSLYRGFSVFHENA